MKLNHLNLTVSNVPETHRFLEKYFGLKGYGGKAPGQAMSFLSDDNGLVLALFRTAKGDRGAISSGLSYRVHPGERRAGQRDQPTSAGGWV
jgi:catechol 2,3-dioxygenase-like lactoylglutathione lyase family enzyme